MGSDSSLGRRLALGLLWLAASTALVLGFAALATGLALAGFALAGIDLGEVQRALWIAFAQAVGLTALAPLAAWTLSAWWALAAARPGLDARWGTVALGTVALALIGFPPVGALCFTAWTAKTPLDYGATWGLVSGGVASALLLARRLVPPLGPGAFGAGNPRRHA